MECFNFAASLVATAPALKRPPEDTPTVPASPRRAAAVSRVTVAQAGQGRIDRGGAIGRYVILSRLGAGAMGVVYAAHDPHLGRKVAVKVLRHDENTVAHPEQARIRLLREARALAKLSHPNVVAVHDVGTLPDGVFIAMEFVPGQTLQQWLREAPRTKEQILAAFLEAGAGLAAAHAVGVVHRDFKPQNVIVGEDGRIRLVDFGLARKTNDGTPESTRKGKAFVPTLMDISVTDAGEVLGTPAFMAPEQFLGEGVSPATDQFAFCVALYRALYGERPFQGETLLELADTIFEGRITPAPRGARVPARVRAALLRGLAIAPADRFQSMDALLAELRAATAPRRWKKIAVVVALLVVALGVGVGRTVSATPTTPRGADAALAVVVGEL